MTDNRADFIDPDRATCLCDVGQPEYLAATVIAGDGAEHLLLARRDAIGDENVRYESTCPHVAHEQPGPLPDVWRHRTALAPLRCGRPTRAGGRCRAYVTAPGEACAWHRSTTTQGEP